MPEWTPWPRVRTSMSARTRPRSDVVSAGSPMSQLPESAITITSARSLSWCSFSSAGRVSEPTSSSPSMKNTTLTGRSSPYARSAAEVGDDPGLVVGGAAAVEPAVPLGRLPRRRVPVGRVVLGLYVVVRVEQHRRRALRPRLARDHRGRSAVGAHDVDGLAPLGAQQVGHRVRRAPHLAGAGRVGADRLDPDQVLEVGAEGGHQVAQRCAEVVAHAPTLDPAGLADDHGLGRQPNGRYGARSARSPLAVTRPPASGVGPGELAGGQRDPGRRRRSRPRPAACRGCAGRRGSPARRRTAAPGPRPSGRARAPRARRGSAW